MKAMGNGAKKIVLCQAKLNGLTLCMIMGKVFLDANISLCT